MTIGISSSVKYFLTSGFFLSLFDSPPIRSPGLYKEILPPERRSTWRTALSTFLPWNHGPRDVQMDDKPRPDIQDPEDIRIADIVQC